MAAGAPLSLVNVRSSCHWPKAANMAATTKDKNKAPIHFGCLATAKKFGALFMKLFRPII
jgi:hypothetical protein